MPQLDVSTYWPQVFWVIVSFALMLGMSIGYILPKMANIFNKRDDSLASASERLEAIGRRNAEFEATYLSRKDEAYSKIKLETEAALAAIGDSRDKKLALLEKETLEKSRALRQELDERLAKFDETYKDSIEEIASVVLKKIGFRDGR